MISEAHVTVTGFITLAPGTLHTPRVGDVYKLTGKVRVTEVVEESTQGNIVIVRVTLQSNEAQLASA